MPPDDTMAALVSLADAVPTAQPPDAHRRWPASLAFLTAPFLPATTARHTTHLGLLRAFAVHVAAWCLLIVGFTFELDLAERRSPFETLAKLVDMASQRPSNFWLSFGITAGVVEGSCFLLAVLIMPWGARDERLRTSLHHAIRTVWIHSVHVAVGLLLLVAVDLLLDRKRRQWWAGTMTSQHMSPGEISRDVYPWYLQRQAELISYTAGGLGLWVLWAMLRAVGARPVCRPSDQTPVCQVCGYNLSGTAADGRCPECGEPFAASIGPGVRPGTPWQRRAALGRWSAWWRTSIGAIVRPQCLCRQARLYTPDRSYGGFILSYIVLTAVAAVVTAAAPHTLIWYSRSGRIPFRDGSGSLYWDFLPAIAGFVPAGIVCIASLMAVLIGLLHSLGQRRNLLPAAVQAFCWMSPWMIVWGAVNVYMINRKAYPHFDLLYYLAFSLHLKPDMVGVTVWVVADAVLACLYCSWLQAAMRGLRFARQ